MRNIAAHIIYWIAWPPFALCSRFDFFAWLYRPANYLMGLSCDIQGDGSGPWRRSE